MALRAHGESAQSSESNLCFTTCFQIGPSNFLLSCPPYQGKSSSDSSTLPSPISRLSPSLFLLFVFRNTIQNNHHQLIVIIILLTSVPLHTSSCTLLCGQICSYYPIIPYCDFLFLRFKDLREWEWGKCGWEKEDEEHESRFFFSLFLTPPIDFFLNFLTFSYLFDIWNWARVWNLLPNWHTSLTTFFFFHLSSPTFHIFQLCPSAEERSVSPAEPVELATSTSAPNYASSSSGPGGGDGAGRRDAREGEENGGSSVLSILRTLLVKMLLCCCWPLGKCATVRINGETVQDGTKQGNGVDQRFSLATKHQPSLMTLCVKCEVV